MPAPPQPAPAQHQQRLSAVPAFGYPASRHTRRGPCAQQHSCRALVFQWRARPAAPHVPTLAWLRSALKSLHIRRSAGQEQAYQRRTDGSLCPLLVHGCHAEAEQGAGRRAGAQSMEQAALPKVRHVRVGFVQLATEPLLSILLVRSANLCIKFVEVIKRRARGRAQQLEGRLEARFEQDWASRRQGCAVAVPRLGRLRSIAVLCQGLRRAGQAAFLELEPGRPACKGFRQVNLASRAAHTSGSATLVLCKKQDLLAPRHLCLRWERSCPVLLFGCAQRAGVKVGRPVPLLVRQAGNRPERACGIGSSHTCSRPGCRAPCEPQTACQAGAVQALRAAPGP